MTAAFLQYGFYLAVLVLAAIPLGAYIAIIYFSEFLNFALSLARLCRVMKKGPPD